MTSNPPPLWQRTASKIFSTVGLTVARTSSLDARLPIEASDTDRLIIDRVKPFTMTSSERIWTLLRAVRYVTEHGIPGSVVECGVWRGGSMMAAALQLLELNAADRELWLYDTFSGMTKPTREDREAATGVTAQQLLDSTPMGAGNNIWCLADENDVRTNMDSTGYPAHLIDLIKGDVSETLNERAPMEISILRLDTDWYASTKVELEVLYERLVPGGVCLLDDYGHWEGARKAVDDFFITHKPRPLMIPIDYSGRIFVKPS